MSCSGASTASSTGSCRTGGYQEWYDRPQRAHVTDQVGAWIRAEAAEAGVATAAERLIYLRGVVDTAATVVMNGLGRRDGVAVAVGLCHLVAVRDLVVADARRALHGG